MRIRIIRNERKVVVRIIELNKTNNHIRNKKNHAFQYTYKHDSLFINDRLALTDFLPAYLFHLQSNGLNRQSILTNNTIDNKLGL
jgi:hypothetical protein